MENKDYKADYGLKGVKLKRKYSTKKVPPATNQKQTKLSKVEI